MEFFDADQGMALFNVVAENSEEDLQRCDRAEALKHNQILHEQNVIRSVRFHEISWVDEADRP